MRNILLASAVLASLLAANSVSAHVSVKPAQAGIGAFQSFSMGVPVEKNSSTVGLRLVLPAGLTYVTPNIKPGWRVAVKKEGTGEEAKVTEITWTGGAIPAGFRDDFLFSAKVPSEETDLQWKAYQTYADGTIVSWDADPSTITGDDDFAAKGPYSVTRVVNDLVSKPVEGKTTERTALVLALAALALAAVAFQHIRGMRSMM